MSAVPPLFQLMELDVSSLSKQEILIVEAELFIRICEKLNEVFKGQYKDLFYLIKLTNEMEKPMLESIVISIIKDILSTEEYTLQGIAEYTHFHQDVIVDMITGKNIYPSSEFLKRIIELHRSVRSELYKTIMKKIALDYL